MKTHWIFSAALALLLSALPAQAQVYKWKDSKGNTVISDTPQPDTPKTAVQPGTGTPVIPNAAPNAPKSLADQDMESRKKRQEQQAAQEQAAKAQTDSTQKQENCQRAQRQQAALESGLRIRRPQADGTAAYINDQERAQEIARAREIMQQNCQ